MGIALKITKMRKLPIARKLLKKALVERNLRGHIGKIMDLALEDFRNEELPEKEREEAIMLAAHLAWMSKYI